MHGRRKHEINWKPYFIGLSALNFKLMHYRMPRYLEFCSG